MHGAHIRERLTLELERLRKSSGSDFAAIALPASDNLAMRWQIVLGSRNGRVSRMAIKPGIGIGGMVLRHGTVYTVSERENAELLAQCPVMLAERLEAGFACPLLGNGSGSADGILLLGSRGEHSYERSGIARIWEQSWLSGLTAVMNGGTIG
ncbi:nitrogen regulatory protein A [Paenibacillus phyllosphaerae]|uniref:Nitrogen regulatory protein A n=1 Tax=Paenibacillus phyllosphaerae TaxID=274593 RepID=A0A7W5AYL1_9BACL|nr:hypothetical protein [Paenibacillus phyllosphaerae]MBB3110972.1 nitrogen regulatory protein A [Paenibacillus phyllosphaerae]